MPLITIGMPVFNDIDFIDESIKSILNQTLTDFKLIISDDGSSDGSQQICEKYSKLDSRITYIRQPKNLGISKNMKFLLSQADTPFFMWAADDDLWNKSFIEKLVTLLKNNPSAIMAFCTFSTIDSKGQVINADQHYNYSNQDVNTRLINFFQTPTDKFGYGVFRTNEISNVHFPTWWWPNNKCAYNNIYPTLCYYLAKGDIVYDNTDSLFFKREKEDTLVNHKLPFKENSFLEVVSYCLRKFNLVIISLRQIIKGGSISNALNVFPTLMTRWFIKPSYYKIKHYIKTVIGIKKSFNNKTSDYLY